MVKAINRFIILLSLFSTIPIERAYTQEFLTLQQAIEITLKNNFSIRIAHNETEIADKNASLGNAGFMPSIDARVGQDKSVQDSRQEFITGQVSDRDGAERESKQAEVSLNWTIFDGFKMFASISRLNKLKDLGEINAKMAMEENITDVIDGYYNVVLQKKRFDFTKETVEFSKERLQIARTNYEIGAGSRLSVLQAKVDLNADSSSLLQQQAAYEKAKTTLNQLLAREVHLDFSVSDTIEIASLLNIKDLQKNAMEENSAIQAAHKNQKVSEMELKEVRSEFFPKVHLTGNYQWSQSESQSGFLLENETSGYTYGVNLSLNIFNGFNTRRKLQNAKIDIRNRKIQLEEIKTQVNAALINMYEDYEKNLQQVSLERENLSVARENLEISLEQFRIGSINSLQLREAQQNFLDAETRLIQAKFRAKQAESELLRLSGRLIESESIE